MSKSMTPMETLAFTLHQEQMEQLAERKDIFPLLKIPMAVALQSKFIHQFREARLRTNSED
jgi:hypothetical protein